MRSLSLYSQILKGRLQTPKGLFSVVHQQYPELTVHWDQPFSASPQGERSRLEPQTVEPDPLLADSDFAQRRTRIRA